MQPEKNVSQENNSSKNKIFKRIINSDTEIDDSQDSHDKIIIDSDNEKSVNAKEGSDPKCMQESEKEENCVASVRDPIT